MEQVSITRIKHLHPKLIDNCIAAYNECVAATPKLVHPYITESFRSFAESNALYQQGRTKPGSIVTNAGAGSSFHNYGLAIDFCNLVNGKMVWEVDDNWMIVVNIFKKHGWEWGGDWKSLKDYPHLQKTFGYTWQQLLVKYDSKNFIEGTQFVNI